MTHLVSVLTGWGLTLLGYNPRLESNIVDGIIKGDKSNQPPPSPAPCSSEINSQAARRPKHAIFPPHVRNRDYGIQQIFAMESWKLGFRIRNTAPGFRNPPTIGVWNPVSTDKESRIQYLGIRNPHRGIQNPRLFWIP